MRTMVWRSRFRRAIRLLALGAVVVAAATLPGCSNPVSGSRTITADFDNANGLYTGNAVSILGMRVGDIAAITPHGSGVRITLRVGRSISLPANVSAVTVSDSVLTDRHIELSPPYRGGPALPDPAALDRDHTRTPVEFDSLLSMADKLSTALAGDGSGNGPVADLLTTGSALTAGNGAGMRDALGQLSAALRMNGDGATTRDAVTKVVTNLDALTAAAARNDATVRDFGSGIRQLGDLFAREQLGTGDTGAQLNEILDRTTELLQRNRPAIAGLTGNANTVMTSLSDYNRNLAEFLDVFPLVTDNVYNAIDQRAGALRATVDLNRFLLDGQMVKEVCNLLGLRNLGCATGTMRDMGPDFGLTEILSAMAGVQPR
ncbi:Mce family protein MceD [Nocardia nova SH22a]|uniref:Mce family protein MceD n=1 Tax=Nocardia nova SH22a TaxID=1415166 RepID=W5TJZ0_9NOCA|nr:MCE family protein [Nocardia nova]AHH19474.1 Mce family protein MceD [Nocardia nova SH22a]